MLGTALFVVVWSPLASSRSVSGASSPNVDSVKRSPGWSTGKSPPELAGQIWKPVVTSKVGLGSRGLACGRA